ncbi:5-methyltetrahydrofolate--homocysteine methyltransferase, partial [hydrothermal vent metagenome]
MRSIIEQLKKNKILVSDGGWGTYLYAKGLQMGDCPELWNETHRSDVLDVAKSYINAGADMIETNSFGGSKIKLEQYDLGDRTYELNKFAAEISREAAGDNKFVLGSVGPTGKFLMTGEVTEEELYDSFKVQVEGLRDGGADAICIETFYDTQEAIIAIDAVKKNTDLEVITTFTFDKAPDGSYNSMMGIKPSQMAETLANAGVDIFGTNCGNGFEGMIDIVKEIRDVNTELPVLVHANAGLPIEEDGKIVYPD